MTDQEQDNIALAKRMDKLEELLGGIEEKYPSYLWQMMLRDDNDFNTLGAAAPFPLRQS